MTNFKITYLFFLLLGGVFNAYAQTNANIFDGSNNNLKFDYVTKSMELSKGCLGFKRQANGISDSRGRIVIKGTRGMLTDRNCNKIQNIFYKCFTSVVIKQHIDSNNFLIIGHYDSLTRDRLTRKITRYPKFDGIYSYNIREQNRKLYNSKVNFVKNIPFVSNGYIFSIARTKNQAYFIFVGKGNVIYSYYSKNGTMFLTDSINNSNVKLMISDSIINNSLLKIYNNNSRIITNSTSNKLYVMEHIAIILDKQGIVLGNIQILKELSFNPNTRKFNKKSIRPIQVHKWVKGESEEKKHSRINGFELSTNDSNLLVFNHDFYPPQKKYIKSYINKYEINKPVLKPTVINTICFNNNSFSGYAFKTPWGEIATLETIYPNLFLNITKNANSMLATKFLCHSQSVDIKNKYFSAANSNDQPMLYDYVKVRPTVNYRHCKAYVHLKNYSDLHNGIDKFQWWIMDKDSVFQTFTGFEPDSLEYTQNGNYIFKIKATSPRGYGYEEWFLDTINIRIPPKPVVNFSSKDTFLCRFKTAYFTPNIMNKTFHPKRGIKYKWEFGDGNILKLKKGKNEYKNVGAYTVALNFSNGYCEQSHTKAKYIKVRPAPNHGFTFNDTSGCTPFNLSITDTIKSNVVKTEYYFADSSQWKGVNKPTFSHIFHKAGHFKVVQRLYGYSGCITQKDSITVHLSPGLAKADKFDMLWSTYKNNKEINLTWQSHIAAKKYQLQRETPGLGFKNIIRPNSINYTDTITESNAYQYRVVGTDSCGTTASYGKTTQVIYVQGKAANDNAFATLEFSPYLGLNPTLNSYRVVSIVNNGTDLIIEPASPITEIKDNKFGLPNKLEKCYQIEGLDNTGQVITRSNILCLPYQPFLFIPNAFSPNNDGINEIFAPMAIGIKSMELSIYNRYGQLLHRGGRTWDGKVEGEIVNQGNYVYVIQAVTATGKQLNKQGTLLLLR